MILLPLTFNLIYEPSKRIVTYYVGLSSHGLWGFHFFETYSFYLN